MDVQLRTHSTLDGTQDLASAIDAYATQVMSEFRDGLTASGVGVSTLERAIAASDGVAITAHNGEGDRLGYCVVVPFPDPLLGDHMPMVVALFTETDYRHRGLAGQMVAAARRDLESRGHMELAARAGHNDDALISMGERWGFVRSWELMVRE
jgi:GNAT superfamily N-acetyltransferase